MSWKFWKKDDLALPDYGSSFGKSDLGLSTNTGLDLSDHFSPGANAASLAPQTNSYPGPSSYPPTSFSNSSFGSTPPMGAPAMPAHETEPSPNISKDLEVIAAKLDTIRAQLEMLNTRVGNLERNSQGQSGPSKRPWY